MITVITATYNHAPFLAGAIASVRGQDLRDWEHLVIDDGSTDDTPRVLAGLAGEGPLRVLRTANQGLPAALNLGLAHARGDLVAFLDADDEYLPDHLSYLVETLENRDFALGRYEVINCTDQPRPVLADFFNPGQEIEVEKTEYGTGVFFGRRAAFLDMGGFRQVPLSDADFFTRMMASGRYSYVKASRPTYRYFFGRAANNMAARELAAASTGRPALEQA
jgi:glycosyltransferase involved in cell wall biosynthesis